MALKQSASYILVIVASLSAIAYLQNLRGMVGLGETGYLAPPPEHIEYFSFGFRESMADSLWLRWIQDTDICQTYAGAGPKVPIQGTGNGELSPENKFLNPRNKFCDNSWGFKMLDAVTRLAPKFQMPYSFGAITLSVFTEDYEGAKVIFDRGVENYPNDWEILYRAAYHYLFDRHEYAHAADLLSRAGKIEGAPYWLNLLAARLYSKTGQMQLGLSTLQAYRALIKDNPKQADDLDRRIAALKEKIAQAQNSEDKKGP